MLRGRCANVRGELIPRCMLACNLNGRIAASRGDVAMCVLFYVRLYSLPFAAADRLAWIREFLDHHYQRVSAALAAAGDTPINHF